MNNHKRQNNILLQAISPKNAIVWRNEANSRFFWNHLRKRCSGASSSPTAAAPVMSWRFAFPSCSGVFPAMLLIGEPPAPVPAESKSPGRVQAPVATCRVCRRAPSTEKQERVWGKRGGGGRRLQGKPSWESGVAVEGELFIHFSSVDRGSN